MPSAHAACSPRNECVLRHKKHFFLSLSRFSAGSEAHILWSVGLTSTSQRNDLLNRVNAANFHTIDVSAVDEVQELMRDFVGGRPRCYMGEIPHEHVYKVWLINIAQPSGRSQLADFVDSRAVMKRLRCRIKTVCSHTFNSKVNAEISCFTICHG